MARPIGRVSVLAIAALCSAAGRAWIAGGWSPGRQCDGSSHDMVPDLTGFWFVLGSALVSVSMLRATQMTDLHNKDMVQSHKEVMQSHRESTEKMLQSMEKNMASMEKNMEANKASMEKNMEANKASMEKNMEANKASMEKNMEANKASMEKNMEANKASTDEIMKLLEEKAAVRTEKMDVRLSLFQRDLSDIRDMLSRRP
ncbi:hypothetical protein AK812_SmicGene9334 [Symbiodinium microadriaticum]|uniref:Uncharacterized protein n=1 Tax=Symbiodinium microadriaticum TaxID=2951 RepID=A0A1Q9EIM4_SYMMI|nr:hypothetical protein AK812_SmicGene9334 [Symbiodinium microadriaticum]